MELEGTDKRWETSLARSATLGDKSWARLTTELTSWNLADSQLCLESKTELHWGWGHRTEKPYTSREVHHTYFRVGII